MYRCPGFTLGASASWTDAKTTQNLCAADDPTYACTGPGNSIAAIKGTRLPITPKFKANATARYEFTGGSTDWWVQGVLAYQGSASSDIRLVQATLLGDIKSSTTVDFSVGAKLSKFSLELFLANAFDERAEISRFVPCSVCYQRPYYFYVRPRTFGIRAGTTF